MAGDCRSTGEIVPVTNSTEEILTEYVDHKALVKRLFDLFIVVFLLFLAAPLIMCLITLVKLDQWLEHDGAPLLITEPRLSHGELFNLVKLNMYREAARRKYMHEDTRYHREGTYAYLQKDPDSLSMTGRLIVKFYLDEMGQFYNVLRGDMSLVGPRPHPANFESNSLPPRQLLKAGLVGFTATRWKNGEHVIPREADMEYLDVYQGSSALGLVLTDIGVIYDAVRAVIKGKGL